jgi:hypothetical protein
MDTYKNRNAEIEKHYFEKFRQVFPFDGTVLYGDSPDVIIEGEKRTGVEITNFFIEDGNLPASEQVQIKRRERVVLAAQQLYQEENGRSIIIIFGFNRLKPILDEKKLKNKLVDLAKTIADFETGEIFKDTYKEIPELEFVYLNANSYEGSRWRVQQIYRSETMSRDRLVKIIKDKEGKVNKYKNCDKYWLLIIVEFMDPAQDQEISTKNFRKIETEAFEKVLVYKTYFNEILEAK